MSDEQRPTLDYRSPEPRRRDSSTRQCIGATIVTTGVTIGSVVALMVASIGIGEGSSNADAIWIIPVLGLAELAGLNLLAFKLYRSTDKRGYGLGIWLGLGIGLLLEGLCFASLH